MGPDKEIRGKTRSPSPISKLEQKVKYHAGKTFGKYYPSASTDKLTVLGVSKNPGGPKPGMPARIMANARLRNRGIDAKVSPGGPVQKGYSSQAAIAKRKGPATAMALKAQATKRKLHTAWLGRKPSQPKAPVVTMSSLPSKVRK